MCTSALWKGLQSVVTGVNMQIGGADADFRLQQDAHTCGANFLEYSVDAFHHVI
jgi:hypothetical protein